jgi:chemotaxis protein methyltransferase CheR
MTARPTRTSAAASAAAGSGGHAITDREFAKFQRFIFEAAGIALADSKKALVAGRLAKRLQLHGLPSYTDYFELISGGQAPDEVQMAVDLLTTNETYFFREPRHFDFLRDLLGQFRGGGRPYRVWSAASSSGEEAYSIAMTLADLLGDVPWEIVGTDISTRVVERARAGHYPMERGERIPKEYLKRFCLRGIGRQDGTFLIEPALRARVKFMQANLNTRLPDLGTFDVVFLRNVLIYFDNDTKRGVVERVAAHLPHGGHLFIGHSETLNDLTSVVRPVSPAIYRKP